MGRVAIVKNSLTFTIAICSLNGENRLPATLKALFDQISHGTPVIVIDDGSTDKTSEIAKQYGATVIRHKVNMGYGYARQSAVEACQTDILAFIDDECLVSVNWYEILSAKWEVMPSTIVALGGPIIPSGKGLMTGYLQRHNPFAPVRSINGSALQFKSRLSKYLFPRYEMNSGYIDSSGNGNLSFRTKLISQLNGYNPNLAQGGEDEELCVRIRKNFGPKSIFFNEQLLVVHETKENFISALRRSSRYGESSAQAWLRYGGVPTYLPLPVAFITVLILLTSYAPWSITITFLIIYPVLLTKVKSLNAVTSILNYLIDPYIRLILETLNNFGFLRGLITGISNPSDRNQIYKIGFK